MFSNDDIRFFNQKGISEQTILQQIAKFKTGFPYAKLVAAATPSNGIIQFEAHEIDQYIEYYDKKLSDYNILKFVPASGAASRMFKHLFEFKDLLSKSSNPKELIDKSQYAEVKLFFENISRFAFYPVLHELIDESGYDFQQLLDNNKYDIILDYLLTEKGLSYASLPKALLLFHSYPDGNRMALEEHLVEGAMYAKSGEEDVHIHFTVSPEHQRSFENAIKATLPKYIRKFAVNYQITYSEQKSSTDTIAVDLDNNPFCDASGKILFRPGGHGALIENLNELKAEIVFIKNIDNVVPDALREPTYRYKKLIGALLIKLQKQIFEYLHMLDKADFSQEELGAMINFVKHELMIPFDDDFESLDTIEKVDFLFNKMNRPIRVCGMVKNEGEPGGGPFWVETDKGVSLQIVESSQIDVDNPNQKDIMESSTHFNPVDLVCGLKNYKGAFFNLIDFVDANTGFISIKSKDGRELKAQELPGLWNGAMADWITLFVEVPIETFNPVKSVNDLLRPQHQA